MNQTALCYLYKLLSKNRKSKSKASQQLIPVLQPLSLHAYDSQGSEITDLQGHETEQKLKQVISTTRKMEKGTCRCHQMKILNLHEYATRKTLSTWQFPSPSICNSARPYVANLNDGWSVRFQDTNILKAQNKYLIKRGINFQPRDGNDA